MAGEQDHRRRARRVRRRAAAHRSSAAQDGQCRAHAASRLRGAAELPRLFRRRGRRHPRVSRRQAGAVAGLISKESRRPRTGGGTTAIRDTADNSPAQRAIADGGGTSGWIMTGAPPPAGGSAIAAGGTGAAAGGAAGGVAATGAGALPGSTTTRVPTFTRV